MNPAVKHFAAAISFQIHHHGPTRGFPTFAIVQLLTAQWHSVPRLTFAARIFPCRSKDPVHPGLHLLTSCLLLSQHRHSAGEETGRGSAKNRRRNCISADTMSLLTLKAIFTKIWVSGPLSLLISFSQMGAGGTGEQSGLDELLCKQPWPLFPQCGLCCNLHFTTKADNCRWRVYVSDRKWMEFDQTEHIRWRREGYTSS